MRLDRTRPYGESCGLPYKVFDQDGRSFNTAGQEVRIENGKPVVVDPDEPEPAPPKRAAPQRAPEIIAGFELQGYRAMSDDELQGLMVVNGEAWTNRIDAIAWLELLDEDKE
jgi:hypothetical protein